MDQYYSAKHATVSLTAKEDIAVETATQAFWTMEATNGLAGRRAQEVTA